MADSEQGSSSELYEPQDALARAIRTTSLTGGAGLILASVQNTMTRRNIGAFGVFTRFGGTIATFAAVGATYGFVSTAAANIREKNDPYNPAIGGFLAGALIGLRKRRFPSVLGNGLALAVILAACDYTGGHLFSDAKDGEDVRYETKEAARKRFRRPLNEWINEVGEGRGIYPPGYDERRAQRLKDAYGIDVPKPYWEQK